jgi:hypothetical protein
MTTLEMLALLAVLEPADEQVNAPQMIEPGLDQPEPAKTVCQPRRDAMIEPQ